MKNEPLYKTIKNHLLKLIQENRNDKNYILPSESQLCLKFNVSRVPIRKALDQLQKEGYIIKKQGKGSFINTELSLGIFAGKQQRLIALILPDISTPFLQNITLGIRKYCDETKSNYILLPSFSSTATEQKNIHLAKKLSCDGILLMPVDGESYNDALLELIVEKTPCIFIDRHLVGLNIPSVSSDHLQMGYESTKRLLDRGFDKIAYFAQTDAITSVNERAQGYIKALTEQGKPKQYLINLSGKNHKTLHEQLEYYLRKTPEINGIIINSGISAANAIRAINAIGKNLDEHFGMVCFDENNFLIDLCLNIKLDSIIQDSFKIGYTAAKLLINQLNHGILPAAKTIIPLL